jgi:hypothetical protein
LQVRHKDNLMRPMLHSISPVFLLCSESMSIHIHAYILSVINKVCIVYIHALYSTHLERIIMMLRKVTLQSVPVVTQLLLSLQRNCVTTFPQQYAMQCLWIPVYLIHSHARHDWVQTRTRAVEEVSNEVLVYCAWRVAN